MKTRRLGDLQLRILKALWHRREATVAEVIEELGPKADLAYTTVATMLRKMETRGLVSHRVEGRTFIYAPRVAENEVARNVVNDLVDRFFAGSLSAAVNHLLTTRDISREELQRLQKLIDERKKKL